MMNPSAQPLAPNSEVQMKARILKNGYSILTAIAILTLVGCGQNGSPNGVTLSFGTYVAQNSFFEFLIPTAHASVSDIRGCFKRLRFKLDVNEDSWDPEISEDNIDFSIGEVSLTSGGTELGTVSVPEGVYRRLEFDLEDDCGTDYALKVSNRNGDFTTSDRITIKFEGQFIAEDSAQQLNLAVEDIIGALTNYDGTDDLKDIAEGTRGSF